MIWIPRSSSIELDPRFTTAEEFRSLGQIGFNRASLGVQDFDPSVQQAVNRVQSVEQTLRIIAAWRTAGFRSINADPTLFAGRLSPHPARQRGIRALARRDLLRPLFGVWQTFRCGILLACHDNDADPAVDGTQGMVTIHRRRIGQADDAGDLARRQAR